MRGASTRRALPALWQPQARHEALAVLREHGDDAKVVAGATAFAIAWKAGLLSATHLVSCTRIADLHGIELLPPDQGRDAGALRIGAAATLQQVERHPLIRRHASVLAATMGVVANLRVRNAATMGGNLAEADYSSDPPGVLAALGATVRLQSAAGSRWVELADFFVDYYQTSIRPDELLTDVELPVLGGDWRGTYLKHTTRSVDDRTCLGVAAFVRIGSDGNCAGLRLAVVGAAPTPLRLPDVENQFAGVTPGSDELKDLAQRYASTADPISDIRGSAEHRRHLIRVLIPRAIRAAHAGQEVSGP
ncbi:MAG: FAD binding domain-containing protein [Micromonosporaceae bacterium]